VYLSVREKTDKFHHSLQFCNNDSFWCFQTIRTKLRPLRKGMRSNIFDNMLAMMEKYANNLETLVDERTHLLIEEKQKTEDLLHLMLPKPVAEQLKQVFFVKRKSTFSNLNIYCNHKKSFPSN